MSSEGTTASTPDRNAWTQPTVERVAPGVYRVPLPLPNDGLRAVNVYVLADDTHAGSGNAGAVLVDAGWSIPDARALLAEGLASLELTPADIRRFLVTHVHRDHYTQAVALRREFGTTVALGADERPSLEVIRGPMTTPLERQLTTLRRLGATTLADGIETAMASRTDPGPDWELPDEWLHPGSMTLDSGRTLEVVATPGHTVGHVVFHDLDARLLFAGDHVLPTITPSIGFEPVLSPNPLGDFLASLAVVRSRPDALLLPAHGAAGGSVHARVDELVAHHGARLDETEAAVAVGATTGYEVAGRLGWTRRLRRLADLDTFNQMLAIAETGAHLTLLAAQGRVRISDVDGVDHVVSS